MKKLDYKKIFVCIFAIAFTSTALALVFTYMTFKNNPEILKQMGTRIGESAAKGKSHQEFAEEDLGGITKVNIQSLHGDVDIRSYDGPTLKIEYYGKVPEKETGNFIGIKRTGDELKINLNHPQESTSFSIVWDASRKGMVFSDSSLDARIYVPKNFTQHLEIDNSNGDIHITDIQTGNLSIRSSNGDIELHGTKSNDLFIKLANGNIDSEGAQAKNWDVTTAHGDIKIALVEGSAYQFDLKTSFGDIQNSANMTAPPDAKNVGTIRAKTAAGDIHIEKYAEDSTDND